MPDIDITRLVPKFELLFRECTPRLLVVTDGSLNAGNGGFGLSRFISTLQATTIHGMTPIVVHRARHDGGQDAAFDDLAIDTFDALFLFGINTTGDDLGGSALDRVKRFMEAGGGVFATGDHEDLGTGMSGDIPRVRAMRYWAASETPHVANPTRLTTNLAGTDRIFEFDDQSDANPQRLYANFQIPSDYWFLAPWPPIATTKVKSPHPLVRMADGSALDVYPDHPHEGECRLPDDLGTTFELDGNTHQEWPGSFFVRPAPRAVASTMSFGNGFDVGPTGPKDAVSPRAFIAMCAYNGQAAGVGRVVTDATWHHYVNINLNGMAPGGVPNADLQRIQRYWSNLANWLMPAKVRRCLWPWLVVRTLALHPVAEEVRIPVEGDLPVPDLRRIGAAVVAAIDDEPGSIGSDVLADVLALATRPTKRRKSDDRFDEYPTQPFSTDVGLALAGALVVETARAAAREAIEHGDGHFEAAVKQVSAEVPHRALEEQRAELERAAKGLELVASMVA